MAALFLLDLLRRLPEEKIGADRRAEDRDEARCEGRSSIRRAGTKTPRSASPHGQMDRQNDRDIGEKAERRELQDRGILAIVEEDLEQHADQSKAERIGDELAANEHLHHGAHRAEVGAKIDDIGDQQQRRRPTRAVAVGNAGEDWLRCRDR